MSDKNEVSTTERAAPKPGKKAAFKRHCQRFWWLHLIIFILIAVFIVLITIFVAVPRLAQDKINAAKLDIVAVKITNPKADSYTMVINSTISTDGTVKANIDPFVGEMYLADTPDQNTFAKINFPPTTAAKHSIVNLEQHDVKIDDMDAFRQFNVWFVNNETVRIGLRGKTEVKPAGLNKKYKVDFVKVLDTKGLNLFKGIQVLDPKANISAPSKDPSYRNFWAQTVIPNPSHFSLEIGNATFENSFEGTDLGKLYINDLNIVPGDNKFDVAGNLDQTKVLAIAGKRPYCSDGVFPFSLTGVNVTFNGADLDYFTYALANANTVAPVNLTETLSNSGVPIKISCSS